MAITTDAAIEVFGTQDDLDSTSAAVTDGSLSVAGDLAQWTNDDDAPKASVTLFADWNTTAPDAYTGLSLYARLMNVDGTNDQEAPDTNFGHEYLGRFPINDVLTNQYITIDVDLPNAYTSQLYEFYIKNETGQTLQAGWYLKITPKADAPHA